LPAYEAWTRDLPDALSSIVSFLVPPADWDLGDEPLMLVGFAWASPDHGEGRQVVARLERDAPPGARIVEPIRWTSWQGHYVNFMAAEDSGPATARAPVYGRRAGQRLAALKRRYDPCNTFRLNHNIAPR
jgi:hypothetical protein